MNGMARWVEVAVADGSFGAYLALPRSGHGPAVVLLQEIFGVNAHIRSLAEQYAADGYMVLAPDLFWRQAPRIELGYDEAGWKRAVELKNATDVGLAQSDIAAAVRTLRGLPGVGPKLAALGYCFGGYLAYLTAANGLVDAAIAYYGGGIPHALDRAGQVTVPTLMHFGGKDSHIPLTAVKDIAERCQEQPNVEIHIYPEAGHGFNCSHRDNYHQRAAALAHGNSLVFLSEYL